MSLRADILSARLNGARRGGDDEDFPVVEMVLRGRWGDVVKVLRPTRGGFARVDEERYPSPWGARVQAVQERGEGTR